MEGGAPAQRIGFQLEKIVNDLEQLQKQIAKRESGMQTIFSAMHDALLVVDSNRQVILTNQTFRKLFDAPEIRLVTCRQEGGAAFMAEAYGKLTGEPGVLLVTRGPGAPVVTSMIASRKYAPLGVGEERG